MTLDVDLRLARSWTTRGDTWILYVRLRVCGGRSRVLHAGAGLRPLRVMWGGRWLWPRTRA